MGGVFHLLLYFGGIDNENVQDGVLVGLLCPFLQAFCTFASYFLRYHAANLLTKLESDSSAKVGAANAKFGRSVVV